MLANLFQAHIQPERIDEAVEVVEEVLIPLFLAHPGARHGYWMANRTTGQVLTMTCWADRQSLLDARAERGRERAEVTEHLGMRVLAVHELEVIGYDEHAEHSRGNGDGGNGDGTVLRWGRATWAEGLSRDLDASLRSLRREIVPPTEGMTASYWLADYGTGNGLGLSLWSGQAELEGSEPQSRRRQALFEKRTGCTIDSTQSYEAIGVTVPARDDVVDLRPEARERMLHPGVLRS